MRYLLSFLLIFSTLSSIAQKTLEPGVLYNSGEKITVPSLGTTIQMPQGWSGGLPFDSEVFVMDCADATASAYVIVDAATESEVKEILSNTIPLDVLSGVNPTGVVSKSGTVTSNIFEPYGMGGAYSSEAFAKIGAHGIGVLAIVISTPESGKKNFSDIRQFVENTTFQKPVIVRPKSNIESTFEGDWEEYMKGRYIKHLKTEHGNSTNIEIWLCSDGSYAFYSSFNHFENTYTSTTTYLDAGEDLGRWSIDQNTLILESTEGQGQRVYPLALNNKGLYLGETKYFRLDNERCP